MVEFRGFFIFSGQYNIINIKTHKHFSSFRKHIVNSLLIWRNKFSLHNLVIEQFILNNNNCYNHTKVSTIFNNIVKKKVLSVENTLDPLYLNYESFIQVEFSILSRRITFSVDYQRFQEISTAGYQAVFN